MQHFQEAVGQETGLTMVPLLYESGDDSTLKATAQSVEPDSVSDMGGGGGTLRAPSIYATGNGSNGTSTNNIGIIDLITE